MHPIDQKRLQHGYLPIYCDPPRRLTPDEQKPRSGHPTLFLENGDVWEPMV